MVVKVKDGGVVYRPIHVAVCVRAKDERDILGLGRRRRRGRGIVAVSATTTGPLIRACQYRRLPRAYT